MQLFCAMHPIKDEMAIVGSRIPYSSFTIWLFLSIEFVITMLLSIFLRILKIFKSLLPEPPRDLTGDVVLVAGATSSLGRSLAAEFVKSGCSVICVDNDHKLIEETASRLKQQHLTTDETKPRHTENDSSRISAYECDFSNRDAIKRTAQKVKDDIGKINTLVTCIDNSSGDVFDTTSKTLMTHFWTVLAFLPMILDQKRAYIIGVTPIASNNDAYHGSKAAVMSFMECMCQELSHHSNDLTFLAFSPIRECSTLKENEERVAKNIVKAVQTNQYNMSVSWISKSLYHISCMIYNGITLLTEWTHFHGCDYHA
ncbi:short-chain dehydrogenase/reductase family 16C member 6-like isoform X1 [Bombus vosnesenskii]|uniref:Short-chain dehydrogenase/reductase family 16C member 6-like isoform X1 n=2 Tax=Bombus vosnesenskii TaxID=207650 RepID=A0A6J3KDV3_9HYME|nr:short-chain dehydrogenase/reductase family 16C member 6-like isoform X1 [Bombus vosnesenskii]